MEVVTRLLSGGKRRRLKCQRSAELFQDQEKAPAIGGAVDLQELHSSFILTPDVLLFEPSDEELFEGSGSTRKRIIFLNTPLLESETKSLVSLHQELFARTGVSDFPEYVKVHALRILQFKKWNAAAAADLIRKCLADRVQKLPIAEADILEDIRSGFMYWHGRDKQCRPCLVIRLENMGDMKNDQEKAVRLVIFVLEYAIRFAMIPGRVENWVVIIDLKNASKLISMMQLYSLACTAKAIATTLEAVYCGRMVWVKLLNMPSDRMASIVNACIPSEKKQKVVVLKDKDIETQLAACFEPHQLEQRYGGTAPDLEPQETYPYKFFPDCVGPSSSSSSSLSTQTSPSVGIKDLHTHCERWFHEGFLWDESSPEVRDAWRQEVTSQSLTRASSGALKPKLQVIPCTDMLHWLRLVDRDEYERLTAEPVAVLGGAREAGEKVSVLGGAREAGEKVRESVDQLEPVCSTIVKPPLLVEPEPCKPDYAHNQDVDLPYVKERQESMGTNETMGVETKVKEPRMEDAEFVESGNGGGGIWSFVSKSFLCCKGSDKIATEIK